MLTEQHVAEAQGLAYVPPAEALAKVYAWTSTHYGATMAIPVPALVVDVDALDHNIRTIGETLLVRACDRTSRLSRLRWHGAWLMPATGHSRARRFARLREWRLPASATISCWQTRYSIGPTPAACGRRRTRHHRRRL